MLREIFPRAHARYSSLFLLGPWMDKFALWLAATGLSTLSIRDRITRAPRLEGLLSDRGIRALGQISRIQFLEFATSRPATDSRLTALVRSLARCLDHFSVLARTPTAPAERLADAFRDHLSQVRGLAASTVRRHRDTAVALLRFLEFDTDPSTLRTLAPQHLEAFVKSAAERRSRASLRQTVSSLRSFLRFLAGRGEVAANLDTSIDLPRVYHRERLPKALPWETVQAFLAGIDRSTAAGRRDYALFLLMTTYGLRCGEAASLRLDGIRWRSAEMRVERPKVLAPIVLPLTDEVGTALLDYLRHARPPSPHREVFLRLRRPFDPVASGTVRQAFRDRAGRSTLDIPFRGTHCLRHSLAMRLLRSNTSLAAIGDLFGHRSPRSTAIYLRLQAEDLRQACLSLPNGSQEAGQ